VPFYELRVGEVGEGVEEGPVLSYKLQVEEVEEGVEVVL